MKKHVVDFFMGGKVRLSENCHIAGFWYCPFGRAENPDAQYPKLVSLSLM